MSNPPPESIKRMKRASGVYLVTVPGSDFVAPIYVGLAGNCWSMKVDEQLKEDGWNPGAVSHGPLTVNSPET